MINYKITPNPLAHEWHIRLTFRQEHDLETEISLLVYFVINLQRGDFGKAFNYFMPILVFTFGILFTEFIRVKFEKHRIF